MVTQNGCYVRWHSSLNNESMSVFCDHHIRNLPTVTLMVLISWALQGTFKYIWGILTYTNINNNNKI